MSNPIADNVEYFIQYEQARNTTTGTGQVVNNDNNSTNNNNSSNSSSYRHSYHTLLRKQQEQQSRLLNRRIQQQTNGGSSVTNGNTQQVGEESRWHSFVRRISVGMPRYDQGQEEEETLSGQVPDQLSPMFAQYYYDFEALRLSQKIWLPEMSEEDDNLPSMEEITKKNAEVADLAESRSNYFEHPFEPTSITGSWEQDHHPYELQDQQGTDCQTIGILYIYNILHLK